MSWSKFLAKNRPFRTCIGTEYSYTGTWAEITLAVRDTIAQNSLTKEALKQCNLCWSSSASLPEHTRQYMKDLFEAWGAPDKFDDDLVKGDISEISFLTLRQLANSGKPVVQRPKKEALSSRTPGWDLVELFFVDKPWFILWEVKGTDEHPQSQSRSAAKQVISRCGPWLAKLSRLLEEELGAVYEDKQAEFAGKLHEFAFKRTEQFHIGVAVVVDDDKLPPRDFEMFDPREQELPPDRQWGVLVGVPSFRLVRQEVVKWMLPH